jgi:hypothetical protein
MHRHALILASLLGLAATAAPAQTVATATKTGTSKAALKSEAKGLALATETVERVSDAQLGIAARVLTGSAECEFNQTVDVDMIREHPGYFKVTFKNQSYLMAPEETSTGAVRLVDAKSGVVWLQIPIKSMLLNARAGQRLVDACTHAEQRAAVQAVAAARAAGASTAPVLLIDPPSATARK